MVAGGRARRASSTSCSSAPSEHRAHDRTRFLRAKALAEQAVLASDVRHTVFAPSIVYAPGDAFLTLLLRMAMVCR